MAVIKNKDIILKDTDGTKLYPLAHRDNNGDVIEDTYLKKLKIGTPIALYDNDGNIISYMDPKDLLFKGSDSEGGLITFDDIPINIVEDVDYAVSDSGTVPPESGWGPMPSSIEEGKYLWTRVTYGNGQVSYSVSYYSRDGQSVYIYSIESSVSVLVRNIEETSEGDITVLTPSTVTFSGFSSIGDTVHTPYTGDFLIQESSDGSTWTQGTVIPSTSLSSNSYVYTPTSGLIRFIKCYLFKANSTSHDPQYAVDVTQVSVVSDGTSGYFTYIRYSAVANPGPGDMKTTPDIYMGIYTGPDATAPTDPSVYTWSKIEGKTIDRVEVKYAQTNTSNNPQLIPETDWKTNPETPVPGMFMWTRIKTYYTIGDPEYTYMVSQNGTVGRGISRVIEYYCLTGTPEEPGSEAEWFEEGSEGFPMMDDDHRYLWNKEVIIYTTGEEDSTSPVLKGVFGKGIKTVINYYLVSDKLTGITVDSSEWDTEIPSYTDTDKYLWNYEKIIYNDGTYENTEPAVKGVYSKDGVPGRGIASVQNLYCSSNNSALPPAPTENWTTNIEETTPLSSTNRYLWGKEIITYTDGTQSPTTPHISATYGDTGLGIKQILEYYKITNSNIQPALPVIASDGTISNLNDWSTTILQPTESNRFLWNFEGTVWTDDSRTYLSYAKLLCVYGKSNYTVTLSNDNHTFGADENGYAIADSTTCSIVGFLGTTRTRTRIDNLQKIGNDYYIQNLPTGISIKVLDNNTINTSLVISVTNDLHSDGTINIPIVVINPIINETSEDDEITITKSFSYSLSKAGADSVVYQLDLSSVVLVRDIKGEISPETLTLTAYSKKGAEQRQLYSGGKFRVKYTLNNNTWTTIYTSSSTESSYTYTIDRSSQTTPEYLEEDLFALECSLLDTSNNILDQQVVPVVSDGLPYTVQLSNPNHTFEGDTEGALPTELTIFIQAYKGNSAVNTKVKTLVFNGRESSESETITPSGSNTFNITTGLDGKIINNNTKTTQLYLDVSNNNKLTTSGVITLNVEIDGQTDFDFPLDFSFSITKKGADGLSPVVYSIEPDSFIIIKDGNSITPTSVTFNAYKTEGNTKNAYGTGTLVIQKLVETNSGSEWQTVSTTSNVDHITVQSSVYSNTLAIACNLYQGSGTTNLLDREEVGVLSQGQSGYSRSFLQLYTRKNGSAPTDNDRPTDFTYNFTTGVLAYGGSGTTAWSTSPPSGDYPLYITTCVVSTQANSGVTQITIPKTSWSTPTLLVKDGADATPTYSVQLSNDSYIFASDTEGAFEQTVDLELFGFIGAELADVTLDTNNITYDPHGSQGTSNTPPDGMQLTTCATSAGTRIITIQITRDFNLTGTITLPITRIGSNNVNITKVFSYATVMHGIDGDPGVSYGLDVYPNIISRDKYSEISSTTVSAHAWKQAGNEARSNYNGYIVLERSEEVTAQGEYNWESVSGGTGTQSVTHTITSQEALTTDAFRFSLFTDSTRTTLVDRQIIAVVTDGIPGVNTATIKLYKRAQSISSGDTPGELTFYFRDYGSEHEAGDLVGNLNDWSQIMPVNNGDPCWVIFATVLSSEDYDTIATSEWSSPTKDTENGTSVAVVNLYQRAATAPTTPPTRVIYNFETGKPSLDTTVSNYSLHNWSDTMPADNNLPCWMITATANSTTSTDKIESTEWNPRNNNQLAPIKIESAARYNNAEVTLYKKSATKPAVPSATLTYHFNNGSLTPTTDYDDWTRYIPDGGNPCWVITATASSQDTEDTITSNEWNGNGQAIMLSISILSTKYAQSTQGTDHTQVTGWGNNIPTVSPGNYLWTQVNYSDGTSTYSSTRQGVNGGDVTISSTSVKYSRSNSGTGTPSYWGDTPATAKRKGHPGNYTYGPAEPGDYLWVRTIVNYSPSGSTTSYSISYIGTDGEDGNSAIIESVSKSSEGVTTIVMVDGEGNRSTITIDDGQDGEKGQPGENGYVHIAWANSANGRVDFSTTVSTNKKYVGMYTDNIEDDSQEYKKYHWSLIKGTDGLNQATITLYRRASSLSDSDRPSVNVTYTFSDGSLSPNGTSTAISTKWYRNIPSGTDPVWVTTAAAIGSGSTATITRTTGWSTPVKFVTNGTNGYNTATIYLYRRTSDSVTLTNNDRPSSSVYYKFSTKELSLSNTNWQATTSVNDWSTTIPSTGGDCLWVTAASVTSQNDISNAIVTNNWSTPVKMSQNGTNGTSPCTVVLDNDSHSFSAGVSSMSADSSTEVKVFVYEGATQLASTGADDGSMGAGTYKIYGYSISTLNTDDDSKLTVSYNNALTGTPKYSKATITAKSGLTTAAGTVTLNIKVKPNSGGSIITLNKVFSWSLSFKGNPGSGGAAAESYYLTLNNNVIIKSLSNGSYSMSPNTITATVYKKVGSGAPTTYSGYYIDVIKNGISGSNGSGTSSSSTVSGIDSTYTSLVFKLYTNSNKTTLIDTQSVAIIGDGINTAIVSLYINADTKPTVYPGNTTYTFSTKTLSPNSGQSLNNWSQDSQYSSTQATWEIHATALSSTDTDNIIGGQGSNCEWSDPIKVSGVAYNRAFLQLFTTVSNPKKPAAITYNFATGAFSDGSHNGVSSALNDYTGTQTWYIKPPTSNGTLIQTTTTSIVSNLDSYSIPRSTATSSVWSDIGPYNEKGDPAYSAYLSNNNIIVNVPGTKVISNTITEYCYIQIYRGSELRPVTSVKVGNSSLPYYIGAGSDNNKKIKISDLGNENSMRKLEFKIPANFDYTDYESGTVNLNITADTLPFVLSLSYLFTLASTGLVSTNTVWHLKDAGLHLELKGNTTQTSNPTPSNPVPIRSVVGDNIINVTGRNILSPDYRNYTNFSMVQNGGTYTIKAPQQSTTGVRVEVTTKASTYAVLTAKTGVNISGYLRNWLALHPNTKFTISFDLYSSVSGNFAVSVRNTDGSNPLIDFSNVAAIANQKVTVTKTATSKSGVAATSQALYISCFTVPSGGYFEISNIQIEQGEQATDYCVASQYNINLPVENLNKKDNLLIGYIPETANSTFPTENPTYPNAQYLIINLTKGETLYVYGSNSTNGSIINLNGNTVTNKVTGTLTNVYATSADFSSGFTNGRILALQDLKLGISFKEGWSQSDGQKLILTKSIINTADYTSAGTDINSVGIELNGFGDYRDYFSYDGSSWYLNKLTTTITYNGSENWSMSSNTVTIAEPSINTIVANNSSLIKCSHFAWGTSDSTPYFNYNSGNLNFRDADGVTSGTRDSWKAWLAEHNITIVAVLASPEVIKITEQSLLNQLEATRFIMAKDKYTYVTRTCAVENFWISYGNPENPFILLPDTSITLGDSTYYEDPALPTPNVEITSTEDAPGIWTLVQPTYILCYKYFACTQTVWEDGTVTFSPMVFEAGITDQLYNINKSISQTNVQVSINTSDISSKVETTTLTEEITSVAGEINSVRQTLTNDYSTTEQTSKMIGNQVGSYTYSKDDIGGLITKSEKNLQAGQKITDNAVTSYATKLSTVNGEVTNLGTAFSVEVDGTYVHDARAFKRTTTTLFNRIASDYAPAVPPAGSTQNRGNWVLYNTTVENGWWNSDIQYRYYYCEEYCNNVVEDGIQYGSMNSSLLPSDDPDRNEYSYSDAIEIVSPLEVILKNNTDEINSKRVNTESYTKTTSAGVEIYAENELAAWHTKEGTGTKQLSIGEDADSARWQFDVDDQTHILNISWYDPTPNS